MFDDDQNFEELRFCRDERTGLRAIVAVYSTALGPALGGTRFHPYPDQESALADVLRLSRSMAYKSALAELPLGGGKAVIIGDPDMDKSEELLRAYGRFVTEMEGRYITAGDVGTKPADLDVIARDCPYVVGRTSASGGSGDSAVLTAYGVLQGIRAAVDHRWHTTELTGLRVGIEGVGKVGGRLVGLLMEAGAEVVVHDIRPSTIAKVIKQRPRVTAQPDRAAFLSAGLDVLAPCALGGVLTHDVAAELRASVVCGAANNQLAHRDVAKVLADRDVLYCPDYVVNAGGLIQVADELTGFDFGRAKASVTKIFQTLRRVLAQAGTEGVTPVQAADELAERRIRTGT